VRLKETAVRLVERHAIVNPNRVPGIQLFREIALQIGRSIPRHAKFPPGIDTVEKPWGSLDARII
jgi:hypothetical protein